MINGPPYRAGGRWAAPVGACPFEDVPATMINAASAALQSFIAGLLCRWPRTSERRSMRVRQSRRRCGHRQTMPSLATIIEQRRF